MALGRPSRRKILTLLVVAGLSLVLDLVFGAFRFVRTDDGAEWSVEESVTIPRPRDQSDVSVEEAIATRRSRRVYSDRALERGELGQSLWATQGVGALLQLLLAVVTTLGIWVFWGL